MNKKRRKMSNEEKIEMIMEAFYRSDAYKQFNALGKRTEITDKPLESYKSYFIYMSMPDENTIDNNPV